MKRFRHNLLFLLSVFLASSQAKEWSVASYPNPTTEDGAKACGRGGITGFVCDPERFITSESADVVEGHIKQIAIADYPYGSSGCRDKSADYSPGFQVAVALASSIRKRAFESVESATERFANGLFDAWGVGEGDCGNGVLLVVAFKDRQVFIATGKAISKFASEDSLHGVIDNMRLRLRAGDYSEAIEQAVIDIGLVLAGAEPHPGPHEESGFDWLSVGIIGAFAAFFGLFGLVSWAGNRQKKKALTLLKKLQKEQETARVSGKYPATSCPICFEDLKPLKTNVEAKQAEVAEPSAPPLEENSQAFQSETDQSAKQPLLVRRKSREKPSEASSAPAPGASSDAEAGCSDEHGQVKDGRKMPLCLPCGHTFCTDCISEWLQRNQNCPICREAVGSGDTAPSTQRQLTTRNERDRGLYDQEREYRMRQLHRRFPQYITPSLVDRVVRHRGDWIDFSSMRNEMMRPAVRSNYQESGHQGSSMSFGGGSHSSHGVGGSW